MSLKPDSWIRYMAENHKMISPFVNRQTEGGAISYGLSSYGYDIRLASEFRYCSNRDIALDPKHPSEKEWEFQSHDRWFYLNPNDFILGRTVERFKIPRDVLTLCIGKSTYARIGVIVNVTPLEPEWEGFLTLEISNTTKNPVVIYPNEGIAQIIFLQGSDVCEVSYADRKGKYQNQTEVTLSRFLEK